jgi:hypothetical protein
LYDRALLGAIGRLTLRIAGAALPGRLRLDLKSGHRKLIYQEQLSGALVVLY